MTENYLNRIKLKLEFDKFNEFIKCQEVEYVA